MKTRTYQIKDVADMAGVSTRALRHYDEIGLLTPSVRSAAGYRLYTDADLLRLQQILIGRSLGLALEDIRKSIDDPALDRKKLLRQQRDALIARAQSTANMIRSIDAAIALLEQPRTEETDTVNNQSIDMKKLFDGFDPAQYEKETEQRWGHTDAYKESARRTRGYTESDWLKLKTESTEIMNDAIVLLRSGVKPVEPQAMDIAERHRLWMDRWFYPCSKGMHVKLADMYEGDPRYAKHFNDFADGLASFLSDAIRANAECGQ
jgi:DNA-binding transcriptional MerR regulator